MANFVIGNNFLFRIGKNRVFLLITGNDNLNALFQIGLRNQLSSVADCPESCLVNDCLLYT